MQTILMHSEIANGMVGYQLFLRNIQAIFDGIRINGGFQGLNLFLTLLFAFLL